LALVQEHQEVAAKTGVKLGGAAISPQGKWAGQWKKFKVGDQRNPTFRVEPASAIMLRFAPK
jgi:hypothetical protein